MAGVVLGLVDVSVSLSATVLGVDSAIAVPAIAVMLPERVEAGVGGRAYRLSVALPLLPLSFGFSAGQQQSRHSLLQSPHLGLTSSHFFLRCLHMTHPVCTRRMRAFGCSAGRVAPGGWAGAAWPGVDRD